MPIHIYEIAKKLGIENKVVLAKAKELGISAKVASSSLDKITAEYLEEQLGEIKSSPVGPVPILKTQPSITIRLNGAEFLEKARTGELQVFLEIVEMEGAPPIKIHLYQDGFVKALSPKPKVESQPLVELDERTKDLFRGAYYTARSNSTDEWVNLAEYGNALKHAKSTFQPQDFGERSLGSLLRRMSDVFEIRGDESNPIVYYVRIRPSNTRSLSKIPSAEQSEVSKKTSFFRIPTAFPKLATGKVHNLKLGFGFIAPDDGSENLFFHATECVDCTIFDLKPGDPVEYEPGMNEHGLYARKVRRT